MNYPNKTIIIVMVLTVLFIFTTVLSIERNHKLNQARKQLETNKNELEYTNDALGSTIKKNLEQKEELETQSVNFQECAIIAVNLNETTEELTQILLEYEETSAETLDWLMDNSYFYGDDKYTAGLIINNHNNRVEILADRFGKAIEVLQ